MKISRNGTIDRIFPGESYAQLTVKYLIASVLTTIVIYVISSLIRKYGPVLWKRCKKYLVVEAGTDVM